MNLDGAVLLMGAIVAFYVYDSMQLLYSNDFVLEARRDGMALGSISALQLRGRCVFVPNPFTPHRPLFRLSWEAGASPESERVASLAPLRHFIGALRLIRLPCQLLLLLLFVALPALLLWHRTPVALLSLLVAMYLVILVMLLQVYLHRRVLQMTGRDFALLAFEALACAPLAINLVRKLSARHDVGGDAIAFAHLVLPSRDACKLRELLQDRIRQAMDYGDESETNSGLLSFQRRVEQLLK